MDEQLQELLEKAQESLEEQNYIDLNSILEDALDLLFDMLEGD